MERNQSFKRTQEVIIWQPKCNCKNQKNKKCKPLISKTKEGIAGEVKVIVDFKKTKNGIVKL